jgi:hypothetical protein
VQLNQSADSLDGVIIEAQVSKSLFSELRTHHIMVVKSDRATGFQPPGRRLANIVK